MRFPVSTRPILTPLTAAIVLAAAAAARLAPWDQVFGGKAPSLIGDTDAWYHVLRAERWLASAPGAPWRDPWLDWPHGADVPWPPLFDGLLALAARAVGGPFVERTTVIAAAAIVPVVLGLLLVGLVAALGRRMLGAGQGWIAALGVALVAAGVDPARVGRPDQHVLEAVLFVAMLVAILPPVGKETRGLGAGAALAALGAIAFWSWMGSALHLLVLLAMTAALHVLPAAGERAGARAATALAVGGLGGAALLAVTVALWGKPGALASGATTGVGGLQVGMSAATGACAALLLAARRWRPPGRSTAARVLELGVSAAVPGAALLLVPPLREGVAGGLVALVAGNRWYATIAEFGPLLDPALTAAENLLSASRGYGLTILAGPLAVLPLVRAWREAPERRPGLVALVILLALFVPATFLRKRFGTYAVVPLALALEVAARGLGRAAAARLGGARVPAPAVAALAAWATAAAAVAPALPEHGLPDPTLPRDKRELLRWISHQPAAPGREAVVAPWSYGHAIQAFAGRPVVTSPFGSEGGAHAMPDAAALWFATDGRRAEALLAARRAGLLLVADVPSETWTLHGFAPAGTPAPYELVPSRGAEQLGETLFYWQLVPIRLFHEDGLASRGDGPLDGFRLVAETPLTSPANPVREEQWKLFEPVTGAQVRVRAAGDGPVRAAVELRTNTGRGFEWSAERAPDADGEVTFRLPYASGDNGLVRAGAWTISSGARSVRLVLHEADVALGRAVEVDLGGPAAARGAAAR